MEKRAMGIGGEKRQRSAYLVGATSAQRILLSGAIVQTHVT
jgi:hypothetical protein